MFITIDDVTPQTLTVLLREAKILLHGAVTRIEQHSPPSTAFGKAQELYHLRVQYSAAGTPLPPEHIFLKFGHSSKEAFFYQQIAPLMASPRLLPQPPLLLQPPLLRCYYAGYDAQSDRTCLLLEDVSATHTQTDWPLPPAMERCEELIDALARLHAGWWQDARLESDLRPELPAGRSWKERLALAAESLPEFLAFLGNRLSTPRRKIFQQVLSSGLPLDAPPRAPNLTLIHGDMHAWNALFPTRPQADGLRIFDWNMWDIGRPTDDLAYLLALHWYPERRSRLEHGLLKRYADSLAGYGVSGYDFETLWNDYRRSTIRCLFIPVWQWRRGIHPAIWWSHLERAMLAFTDLNCQEVL